MGHRWTQMKKQKENWLLSVSIGAPSVANSLSFPEFFPPLPSRLFHVAVLSRAAHARECRHAEHELLHPVAREFAALGFGEDLAHFGFVDDARAARSYRELAGAAAAVADVFLDADFVHHVDHAAQRADRLGVREARRI